MIKRDNIIHYKYTLQLVEKDSFTVIEKVETHTVNDTEFQEAFLFFQQDLTITVQ